MRWILNLLITALVLWGASKLMPNAVQVGGFWSLLLVALVLSVITFLIQLACVGLMTVGVLFNGVFWVIAGVVIAACAGYFALSLASEWIDGFCITGFWPKVAVAVASDLFSFKSPDD